MTLIERRATLIKQINNIKDEETLELLEETIKIYTHSDTKDVTDGLSDLQIKELIGLMEEPAEKDTISEAEYKNMTSRWRTK